MVLPIKIYNGYLVVAHGTIGSLGKRNLAIDTGAYPSVIDRSLAKKVHALGEKEELRVIERNINSTTAVLPEIELGPIHATNIRMVAQDLTALSERFGVRVDALIGMDVLAHSSFRIDYGNKTISFGPVDAMRFSAPLRWTAQHACVDLNIDGKTAHLLVDTGASSVLLFTERLPWLESYSGSRHNFSNLGGSFPLREAKVARLELAGTDVGPGEVFISDARNMAAFEFDGFLAAGALPFRQVAFDFEHQIFGWEPGTTKADAARVSRGVRAVPGPLAASNAPMTQVPTSMGLMRTCTHDPVTGTEGLCEYPQMPRAVK